MACRTIYRDGKSIGIACGSFNSAKQDRCDCGNPFTALCDYPLKLLPDKKWQTCDKKMCENCLIEGVSENVHFCEEHFQSAKDAYDRKLQKQLTTETREFSSIEEKRGMSIYAMGLVEYTDGLIFNVVTPSLRGKQATYKVRIEAQGVGSVLKCGCIAFEESKEKSFKCDHIYAVCFYLEKEVFNEVKNEKGKL